MSFTSPMRPMRTMSPMSPMRSTRARLRPRLRMRTAPAAAILALSLPAAAPPVRAQPEPPLRAELYTIGAGDFLFTKFGHAALCVIEDTAGDGVCYNYGTADFSRPVGLGWDVIRGRARFWVSVSSRSEMIRSFQLDDRTIYRQALPLGDDAVRGLARRLAVDALPENRDYLYNHFLDNCSTRPRDLIDAASYRKLESAALDEPTTYRRLARRGFGHDRALLMASDFILGRWADQPIGAFEAMFLPEVLRESAASVLGAEVEVVYRRRAPLPPLRVREIQTEALAAVAAIVMLALVVSWRGSEGSRLRVRRAAGLVLGSLGSLLVTLALVSTLPELRGNELVLVFWPFDYLLLSSRRQLVARYTGFRLAVLLVVGALVLLGVLRQPMGSFWLLSFGLLAASAVGLGRVR